jgi:ABC-type Fe3+ transport system substrate-binding protein
MKRQGLPVDTAAPPGAPGTLSAGNGLLGLINKAAHPNAARIFVNWLASKEGMDILGRARHKPTTRNDLDESYTLPWEVPKPGVDYVDAYDWEFTHTMRTKVNGIMKELLKGR